MVWDVERRSAEEERITADMVRRLEAGLDADEEEGGGDEVYGTVLPRPP